MSNGSCKPPITAARRFVIGNLRARTAFNSGHGPRFCRCGTASSWDTSLNSGRGTSCRLEPSCAKPKCPAAPAFRHSPDFSIPVDIATKILFERLQQRELKLLHLAELLLQLGHSFFQRIGGGLLIRNLALLHQVPK